MSELILHIGTPKTGSTSLQAFFCDNRATFKKNEVYYPRFTPQHKDVCAIWRNGCFLSRYCLALASNEEISNQVSKFEENYNKLADALKENNRVLLSDENFTTFSNRIFKGRHDPKTYWGVLDRVAKKLEINKITFIVYLRRQDDFAVSLWKEHVKYGFYQQRIQEFLALSSTKQMLDYATMLDGIHDAVKTPKQIIVRAYHKAAVTHESLYHDFCEAAGIDWTPNYRIPAERKNVSISFDVAEALLTYKCRDPKRSSNNECNLCDLATTLSRQSPDINGTRILSRKETKILLEEFADGNRRIEEQYFDGKKLFPEVSEDDPVWQPNEQRIKRYRLAFEYLINEF